MTMPGLSISVTTPIEQLLTPLHRWQGVQLSTGPFGFAALQAFIPLSLDESFYIYDRPGLPTVTAHYAGALVWEGRLEDVSITTNGVQLGAYGYWRGYQEVPLNRTWPSRTIRQMVQDIVSDVNAVNSFMSSNTALIQDNGLTVAEVFEDVPASQALTRLVKYGDNQTPPRLWEVGVWEDKVLHFRPRGDNNRAWYVDVAALQLDRTLETLWNSAYVVYRSAVGTRLVTATANDQPAIDRYGLTRRAAISFDTQTLARAETVRDAFLDDHKNPPMAANVAFTALYDASGTRWPLFFARAGDTLTIRNLPSTSSIDVDRIRTFRIGETRCQIPLHAPPTLTVVPEGPRLTPITPIAPQLIAVGLPPIAPGGEPGAVVGGPPVPPPEGGAVGLPPIPPF